MSTASDIGAPATEQGAGLLNVLAAVREAKSIDVTSGNDAAGGADGGLLLDPGQINVVQDPGDTATQSVQVTNTGASPVTVNLSTRALASTPVASQIGNFCMQPRTPTQGCRRTRGTFAIWSGVNEVYQDESFRVPATNGLSRPTRLRGRLHVLRSILVAALRAVGAQRGLRRVLAPPRSRRLRRGRGDRSAAREVDRGLLHPGARGFSARAPAVQWSPTP